MEARLNSNIPPPARACRWRPQLLCRLKACHPPAPSDKIPGTIFSTQLSETEGLGGPPPELPLVLNNLYYGKVEADIEQERLCVRFFVSEDHTAPLTFPLLTSTAYQLQFPSAKGARPATSSGIPCYLALELSMGSLWPAYRRAWAR